MKAVHEDEHGLAATTIVGTIEVIDSQNEGVYRLGVQDPSLLAHPINSIRPFARPN